MSWFQDFLSLGEDDEERQQRLLHEQQEEQGSNKRLVKAVAEDIEHELDDLADGLLNFVGKAATFFSSNSLKEEKLNMNVPLTIGIIGSGLPHYDLYLYDMCTTTFYDGVFTNTYC
eukprot:m.72470 g.72470  ORF g.72470 m.72470 type:complete len:116 (+) comp11737_c0_seq15:124-471(+)